MADGKNLYPEYTEHLPYFSLKSLRPFAGLRFCDFIIYLSGLHFYSIWEENNPFYFSSKFMSELIGN